MTNFATRPWLSRILLGAAGITSLCLSLYELFISTILDYGHLTNWSAGTCLSLPSPLFLVSLKSVKRSALLLLLLPCCVWAVYGFL